MSAYVETEIQFKDVEALVAALSDMGYKTVERHAEPVNLYGYKGDIRDQKANLVIRKNYVGSASNDIGFLKNADGTYTALISEYDGGFLRDKHKCPDFLSELKARAGAHAAVYAAQRMGRKVQTKIEGRKIIITVSR